MCVHRVIVASCLLTSYTGGVFYGGVGGCWGNANEAAEHIGRRALWDAYMTETMP